jgi:hypothetical protein
MSDCTFVEEQVVDDFKVELFTYFLAEFHLRYGLEIYLDQTPKVPILSGHFSVPRLASINVLL